MFLKAKPIYPLGKSKEMNSFAAFRTVLNGKKNDVKIYVTASSFYQLWINGSFVSFGPARTAGGYARVDILSLDEYLNNEENELIFLVSGYLCTSLSTVMQPSFLQAEIRAENEVLAASGYDIEAFLPPQRLKKVKRYSIQRHFSEVWDFGDGTDMCVSKYRSEIEIVDQPKLLDRRSPYPHYEDKLPKRTFVKGSLKYNEALPFKKLPYSEKLYEKYGSEFKSSDVIYDPYVWIQRREQFVEDKNATFPVTLNENEYVLLDFSQIETGFIKLLADIKVSSDIIIGFSEEHCIDKFAYTNMNAYNAIELFSNGGKIDFTSFEPYVGRYFIVAVKKGSVTLEGFGVKTFEHEMSDVKLQAPNDPILRSVFRGACRTFAHNAVDIYMDCPSRERAGWLCDSFFTGKVEYALFGETPIEDAFLENYRLFENHGEYPEGVIPMCYPSDAEEDKKFIPQWTMWYILEAEEYINRRGHRKDAELFRNSIEGLLGFYKRYENEDGLLENLPSWNFVEWSAANRWTQNVNYPTNFLYAEVLEAVYKIFGNEEYLSRSRNVREQVIRQSFDGVRFYDHSVRDDNGKLILQKDCSEIAQYYALLFGNIDINEERYAPLKELITENCVVDGENYPKDMEPVNAFIGVYLRLEALLKIKQYDIALREVKAFFGEMESETGTLWEYRQRIGSRDHGFASYALVIILRALDNN